MRGSKAFHGGFRARHTLNIKCYRKSVCRKFRLGVATHILFREGIKENIRYKKRGKKERKSTTS